MRRENPAVDFVDRWRPFGLVVAVTVGGLFVGMLIGLFSCRQTGTLDAAKEERYYVLASKLYAQGESLDSLKVYLASQGAQDASSNVVRLAEKYEKSTDDGRRHEAGDLRQLADALRSGPGLFSSLGRVPLPTVVVPSGAQAPVATENRTAAPPAPTATAAPAPPAPTPTSAPASPAVTGRGIAKSAGSEGVMVREQPTTKSKLVIGIPSGGKVEVLKVVDGEAVDSSEPRWYQVKYGDKSGYVYFKLIVQGD